MRRQPLVVRRVDNDFGLAKELLDRSGDTTMVEVPWSLVKATSVTPGVRLRAA